MKCRNHFLAACPRLPYKLSRRATIAANLIRKAGASDLDWLELVD
jgi:hypothetical protein